VFVKPDVYANPETIDFGELPLGLLAREPSRLAQRTETIIVRRRQGPFSIEEITCDVAGLAIVRDPAEGTSEAFRIDVSPEPRSLSPGKTLTGTITIRTNDSRFPELRVPVSAVPKP
jgi:hypothetical protein